MCRSSTAFFHPPDWQQWKTTGANDLLCPAIFVIWFVGCCWVQINMLEGACVSNPVETWDKWRLLRCYYRSKYTKHKQRNLELAMSGNKHERVSKLKLKLWKLSAILYKLYIGVITCWSKCTSKVRACDNHLPTVCLSAKENPLLWTFWIFPLVYWQTEIY